MYSRTLKKDTLKTFQIVPSLTHSVAKRRFSASRAAICKKIHSAPRGISPGRGGRRSVLNLSREDKSSEADNPAQRAPLSYQRRSKFNVIRRDRDGNGPAVMPPSPLDDSTRTPARRASYIVNWSIGGSRRRRRLSARKRKSKRSGRIQTRRFNEIW